MKVGLGVEIALCAKTTIRFTRASYYSVLLSKGSKINKIGTFMFKT